MAKSPYFSGIEKVRVLLQYIQVGLLTIGPTSRYAYGFNRMQRLPEFGKDKSRANTFARLFDVLFIVFGAGVLAVYAHRLFMPLPLYAWDEESFAIRALFTVEQATRNFFSADQGNSAFLLLIRGTHSLTDNYVQALRIVNVALYAFGMAAVYATVRGALPGARKWIWLGVAIAFPYYRFIFSDLPEGSYVGVVGAIAWAIWRLDARPLLQSATLGTLCAVLVLIKPHGIAVVLGLFIAMALQSATSRRELAQSALELVALFAAFVIVGNILKVMNGEYVRSPLTFFVDDFHGGTLSLPLSDASSIFAGIKSLVAMASCIAMFCGVPLVAAAIDTYQTVVKPTTRTRIGQRTKVLIFLVMSLSATLCMVSIFAAKMAFNPFESNRLWGRYFEFFVPLVWLAAAPAIDRWYAKAKRTSLVCAAVLVLAGLVGLLLSFRAGLVLFPWDGTGVSAFFEPDAVRAPFLVTIPFRPLAVLGTATAAVCVVMRVDVVRTWFAYFVFLGILSTKFDADAMHGLIERQEMLASELKAASLILARTPGDTIAIVQNGNDANVTFVELGRRTGEALWIPFSVLPKMLTEFDTVVTVDPHTPPSNLGTWTEIYRGKLISVLKNPLDHLNR